MATLGTLPSIARAQPADVAAIGPLSERHPLPAAPEDYRTEQFGDVRWDFPAAADDEIQDLLDAYEDAWPAITRDLGGPVPDELVIRVGRNPEEMRALAPRGSPPPSYAVGVAYPQLGLVLLTLSAPESWERPDMEGVLAHELSHIALHRAVEGAQDDGGEERLAAGGRRLPRWFVEGLAIYQAGESNLERVRTLWAATVAGNVLPLDRLDASFPGRPHRVNIAYAQSADMVGFMRNGEGNPGRFRQLIAKLKEGLSFEDAVRSGYGMSLASLEYRWRGELEDRFHTIPLIASGGGLWVIASILLIVAYVRRRRRNRRKLMEWARAEAAQDAAVGSLDRVLDARMAEEPPPGRTVFLVPGDPPQGREPGVPTVEYEGRDHTLH